MLFAKYRNFSATTSPDPEAIRKYSFIAQSPVPSFTGKWAPRFDGNIDTAIVVSIMGKLITIIQYEHRHRLVI